MWYKHRSKHSSQLQRKGNKTVQQKNKSESYYQKITFQSEDTKVRSSERLTVTFELLTFPVTSLTLKHCLIFYLLLASTVMSFSQTRRQGSPKTS